MALILSFVQGATAADAKSKREKGQKGLQGSLTKGLSTLRTFCRPTCLLAFVKTFPLKAVITKNN